MQITLLEDDGILFGGVPKNIVIQVVFDDGTKRRLPYSAKKSISSLYKSLTEISFLSYPSPYIQEELIISKEAIKVQDNPDRASEVPSRLNKDQKNGVIEKEDIVRLIRLESRGEGASCDLIIGHEYRVLNVFQSGITLPGSDKITNIPYGFDIIDDGSARPERTRVFPQEVELVRKRSVFIKKEEGKIEEILPCLECNEPVACVLEGDTFKGVCPNCSIDNSIHRIIRKCGNDKCKNNVSLFDTGINLRGVCNKCQYVMEVDNAEQSSASH